MPIFVTQDGGLYVNLCSDAPKEFAEVSKSFRLQHDMGQQTLATLCGLSRETIRQIENGAVNTKLASLIALSKVISTYNN